MSCFRRRPGSRNWRAAGTKPVTSMAERIRASRGHGIQSSTATRVLPRGSLPAPSLRSLPRHGTRHPCGAVEIVKRALATAPTRSSSAKSRSVTLGTFPVSADLPSAFRVHRAGRPPAAPDVQAQHAPGTGVGAGATPGSPDLIPPGRAVSPGASNGAALNCRQSASRTGTSSSVPACRPCGVWCCSRVPSRWLGGGPEPPPGQEIFAVTLCGEATLTF